MKKFLLGVLAGIVLSAGGLFIWSGIQMRKLEDQIDRGAEGIKLVPPALDKKNIEIPTASFNMSLLELRSGREIDSSTLKGKVLLINFWERWCIPCRIEMESIGRLHKNFTDSVLSILVVSTENMKATQNDSMVKHSSIPFYHLESKIPESFLSPYIPRTYVVNKKGEITTLEFGKSDWGSPTVTRYLDSLTKQ